MILAEYQKRFRRAHMTTLYASAFLVFTLTLTVFFRMHSWYPRPTPAVADLEVGVDTVSCACECREEDESLQCGTRQDHRPPEPTANTDEYVDNPNCPRDCYGCYTPDGICKSVEEGAVKEACGTSPGAGKGGGQKKYSTGRDGIWCHGTQLVDELSTINETGCLLPLPYPPMGLAPMARVEHCKCLVPAEGEIVYSCRSHLHFEQDKVQAVRSMATGHAALAIVALIWMAHHVFAIHWKILPQMDQAPLHVAWVEHWLDEYWDPMHLVALWTIWAQALPLCISIPTPTPFPMPQDWGAPGFIGLMFRLAIVVFAVAVLGYLYKMPIEVDGADGPKPAEGGDKVTALFALVVVLTIVSLGLMLGEPISEMYSFFTVVPLWVAQFCPRMNLSWALDQPLMCGAPWRLPAEDERLWVEIGAELKEIEARWREGGQRIQVGHLHSLCTEVLALQEKHPWRGLEDVEDRLQSFVLDALKTTLKEAKNGELLHGLLKAARILGYHPVPEPEEEELANQLELQQRKEQEESRRCRCCIPRAAGYAMLGNKSVEARPLIRDEAWSTEVHGAMRSAFQQAAEAARLLEDDRSLRWFAAVCEAISPDTMFELAFSLHHSTAALQSMLADDWDPTELHRVTAVAAGLRPYSEDSRGRTAVGWALGLTLPQARGTLQSMMRRMPRRGRGPDDALEVLEGKRSSAWVDGCCACAAGFAIIGAPAMCAEGDGRWFFELRIYGHHQGMFQPGEMNPMANVVQVGWGNEDGFSRRSGGLDPQSCVDASVPRQNSGLPAVFARAPLSVGRGTVGCALEVQNGICRAWFARDGDWDDKWQEKPTRTWPLGSTQLKTMPFPVIAGRFACEFVFEATSYVFGPPDGSFDTLPLPGLSSRPSTDRRAPAPEPTVMGKAVNPDDLL